MATKKQKREAALAKRAKFLAEEKTIGLRAQEWDREKRKEREIAMFNAALEVEFMNAAHHEPILRVVTPQEVASAMRFVHASAISAAQHENLMANGPSRSQIDKLAEALDISRGE